MGQQRKTLGRMTNSQDSNFARKRAKNCNGIKADEQLINPAELHRQNSTSISRNLINAGDRNDSGEKRMSLKLPDKSNRVTVQRHRCERKPPNNDQRIYKLTLLASFFFRFSISFFLA